jgi:hypothetical protein
MKRIWPALGLFFLAPLVAEFLLGNLPISDLAAVIVLALIGNAVFSLLAVALLVSATIRRDNFGNS